MEHPGIQIALIGLLGIGAQWLAWRWRIPAIVLLMAFGLAAGPFGGLVHPEALFGDLLKPLVALSVAIILFEGGLSLDIAEIRHTSKAVRRIVFIGAPLTWGLLYLAARHAAGLSPPAAAILSGILVVTGPTVIMPLLRQARLPLGPASLLRWEAILVDPVGALFAALAYETVVLLYGDTGSADMLVLRGAAALAAAFAIGYGMAWLLIRGFVRSFIPEYLKAAVLLIAVLTAFEATNLILPEAGLLTVTVMGMVIGNSNIASYNEIRRFKEIMTILLVSGVFIVLTATITLDDMRNISTGDLVFLAILLFLVRPAVVLLTTAGSQLTLRERLLCGWIAPRGVVAVAVSGLFASGLTALGIGDGARLVPLAFLVVFATVVLHGLTIRPAARLLGITRKERDGLLIVGGSRWSAALAQMLKSLDTPVLVADRNPAKLRLARGAGTPVYAGEILSEMVAGRIEKSRYSALLAASDNDAYNSLVCTDFGPEMGRSNVFETGRTTSSEDSENALPTTLTGRPLFETGAGYWELEDRIRAGWRFTALSLLDPELLENLDDSFGEDSAAVALLKPAGGLLMGERNVALNAAKGDTVVIFHPARPQNPKSRHSSTVQDDRLDSTD